MIAALELSFDPLVSVGGVLIRWDALALVGVLLVAIGVWVVRLHEALGPALRFDEVCFVLLGAIPGAVVGGRIVHVLDYWDGYLLRPLTMLDLGHGSSSLVGAVVGGALSAAYICRLLGGRVGVWADAAAVPLLLAVGLGKLALLLGGSGQGAATDGLLGLSFTGRGPWRSIDAATAAWPSQALEGGWALLGIPVVLIVETILRAPWPERPGDRPARGDGLVARRAGRGGAHLAGRAPPGTDGRRDRGDRCRPGGGARRASSSPGAGRWRRMLATRPYQRVPV